MSSEVKAMFAGLDRTKSAAARPSSSAGSLAQTDTTGVANPFRWA
jgi:hypothetical protein